MAEPYGSVIRRLRDARGWSQQDLAARSHVHRETIVRAEQSGNVGVLLLYQVAEALDVEISEFFGGGKGSGARVDETPPVWSRLASEQRAQVLRFAYRLLGERAPQGAQQ